MWRMGSGRSFRAHYNRAMSTDSTAHGHRLCAARTTPTAPARRTEGRARSHARGRARALGRARSAAFAASLFALMLSACVTTPGNEPLESLDERTGTTMTALRRPLELVAVDARAAGADPFAYVGTFETNRMGRRASYLWLAVPNEARVELGITLRLDTGETLEVGTLIASPCRTRRCVRSLRHVASTSMWPIPTPRNQCASAAPSTRRICSRSSRRRWACSPAPAPRVSCSRRASRGAAPRAEHRHAARRDRGPGCTAAAATPECRNSAA
jgi:hypothetical protein